MLLRLFLACFKGRCKRTQRYAQVAAAIPARRRPTCKKDIFRVRVNIFELSGINAFKQEGTENKEAANEHPECFLGLDIFKIALVL